MGSAVSLDEDCWRIRSPDDFTREVSCLIGPEILDLLAHSGPESLRFEVSLKTKKELRGELGLEERASFFGALVEIPATSLTAPFEASRISDLEGIRRVAKKLR